MEIFRKMSETSKKWHGHLQCVYNNYARFEECQLKWLHKVGTLLKTPTRPPGNHHSISRMHFVQPGQKYLNDSTLFLDFCDYPPFEEDLDLHFNKLEFPSCKKCLNKVWLKLGRCFILKHFFGYTNVKIVSPLVSPTFTLGDHNLYKLKDDAH
jgi:hypothetical protein